MPFPTNPCHSEECEARRGNLPVRCLLLCALSMNHTRRLPRPFGPRNDTILITSPKLRLANVGAATCRPYTFPRGEGGFFDRKGEKDGRGTAAERVWEYAYMLSNPVDCSPHSSSDLTSFGHLPPGGRVWSSLPFQDDLFILPHAKPIFPAVLIGQK